jgi:hypothetical protein
MARKLSDLLSEIGEGTETEVSMAYKRYNLKIREILSDLTRFKIDNNLVGRGVRIVPGLPLKLTVLLEGHDVTADDSWARERIGARLADIERVQMGIESLMPLFVHLRQIPDWQERTAEYEVSLYKTHDTLEEMARIAYAAQLIPVIKEIREDILGIYEQNGSTIKLYWAVIGAIARLLGISVTGLTVVVLAHELAHLYTHIGADAAKKRGSMDSGTAMMMSVKESRSTTPTTSYAV